jgi:hypothetical protein
VLGTSEPPWSGAVDDYYQQTLRAFRSVTPVDGFVYGVSDYTVYRFWPHRGDPSAQWLLGWPGAIEWDWSADSFIVPPDFSWVLRATDDRISISGDALLAAYERYRPLWSRASDHHLHTRA